MAEWTKEEENEYWRMTERRRMANETTIRQLSIPILKKAVEKLESGEVPDNDLTIEAFGWNGYIIKIKFYENKGGTP